MYFYKIVSYTIQEIDASAYAGHSFRIRAVTTAMACICRLLESLIKMLGRWECTVYVLYTYERNIQSYVLLHKN